MQNEIIRKKWEEFINSKYKIYFLSNEEEWINKLDEVKKYINKYNKTPSTHDKDEDIKQIGIWISKQKTNYNIDINKCKEGIKNEEIYNKWTEFINDNKYKKYFKNVNNEI